MFKSNKILKLLALLLCSTGLFFCSDSKKSSAPPGNSATDDPFGGSTTGIDTGISGDGSTSTDDSNGMSKDTLIFIKSHEELFAELLDNEDFKKCHNTEKKVYNWIKKTCTDVPLATSYSCDEAGAKKKFPDSSSLTTNLSNGFKVAQCGEKSADEPLILLIKKTETTAANGAPEVSADIKVHCYTSSDFCSQANWQ